MQPCTMFQCWEPPEERVKAEHKQWQPDPKSGGFDGPALSLSDFVLEMSVISHDTVTY